MISREQIALAATMAVGYGTIYLGPSILRRLACLPKMFGLSLRSKTKGAFIQIGNLKITDEERLRHTHIVGATGSGKTVLLENLIYEDIARGYGCLIIDPKGDREFLGRIREFSKTQGREIDFKLLSSIYTNESLAWNPCRVGIAQEIETKLMNAWTFSEPFYEKACSAALLEVLKKLGTGSLSLRLLSEELEILTKKEKNHPARALHLDIHNLLESTWGEILLPKDDREELILLNLIRNGHILFVDLPTEGRSRDSARIGKLLLQELLLTSGYLKSYPSLRPQRPFSVYIDEFDAFATQSFISLLNKGRSSGFMIHLAHQTLSDLKRVDEGEGTFQGQVMGNTNIRFVFRQDDPVDSETWSKFFGTKLTIKSTYRTTDGLATGESSNRESLEFRIHPDSIKELSVGQCIASIKSRRLLELKQIPLPQPSKYRIELPLIRQSNSKTKTTESKTEVISL